MSVLGKTLLLVEDEVLIALNEKLSLEKYGYIVKTASSGKKAIKAVQESDDIDLILMDIDLGPGIDGTQTAELILKEYDLPILFMSSHSEREIVEKTEKITSYGYVLKNSSITVLDASIKMAFKLFIANDAVKHNVRMLNIAQKVSHVGSWVWHVQSNVLEWSDEMYLLFGIDKANFKGLLTEIINTAIHPDDKKKVEESNRSVSDQGIPIPLEYRIVWDDGSIHTVWAEAGELLVDKEGKPDKLYGIVKDITEKDKYEKVLEESEQKFRSLFELSPVGMAMVDHKTGNFLEVNNSVLQSTGYTKDEFIKLSFWDVTPKQYEIQDLANIEDLKKTGRFGPNEKEYIRKDGTRYPVRISGYLTSLNDHKVAWGIIEDISIQKEAEQKINRLIQEKDLILKEVHHRIKNNLNTVAAFLNLQSYQKNIDASAVLKEAALRVQSMLILYEKLFETNQYQSLSLQNYIASLIEEMVKIFPKKVLFNNTIEDISLNVKTLSILGTIINELITNSMKYAFGNKEGEIRIHAYQKKYMVVIEYQDNGTGIPEPVDFDKPTGFGLQLIKLLTEQLRGTIQLKRDNGTHFILEFKYE